MANLTGKVALVTGGSRGIGAATAQRLAADGATVAISYNASADRARQVVDAITEAGGTAQAYQADAASSEATAALVRQVVRDHGGLDVLINNAGVYATGPLAEFSDADYDRNMDVNLRGSFAALREAARHMNDGGRVVNVGSVVGKVGMPQNAIYGAAKASVAILARSAAKELGARGITVNTVHPGPIDTEMNPGDPEQNPMAGTMAGMTALGRYGTADEVASVIAFLASSDASYVTGAEITIDGGMIA